MATCLSIMDITSASRRHKLKAGDNVFTKIFKGSTSGQEIYKTIVKIDNNGNDNHGQIMTQQHVDIPTQNETGVDYLLTVSSDTSGVFLYAPITFTAAVIRK